MLNRLLRYILLNLLAITTALAVFSQNEPENDTVINLPEVHIQASQLLENSTGLTIRLIDSSICSDYATETLADLITQKTAVHVQSYNPGNLATVTFRGTTSNHTGFYWNGISLSPSNNGITDLSLLPVALFERIHILYGPSSSVFGEGNIGGGFHMANESHFHKEQSFKAAIDYGSFHTLRTSLVGKFSTPVWSLRTGAFMIDARNDFKYTNDQKADQPVETMDNSRQKGFGILQTISRRFGRYQTVMLDFWYQQMEREIPGSLLYPSENADQYDRFTRGIITWEKTGLRTILQAKGAFFNDFMHYTDIYSDYPEFSIDSKMQTQTWTGEVIGKHKLSKSMEVHGTGSVRYSTVKADYYDAKKDQLQGSLFVSLKWFMPMDGWKTALNLRQGWTQDYKEPFTPSLGIEGPIGEWINLQANVSRNFRSPTLNERYWQPGGNPGLKPETSWNEEITLVLGNPSDQLLLMDLLSVTFYHSMINDWIQWVPEPDDPYLWKPQNVQEVRAYGMESHLDLSQAAGKLLIAFNGSYTYSRSIDQSEESATFREQLSYVPEHKGVLDLTLALRDLSVDYTHTFTGERATVSDHSEILPAYSLGRIMIGYQLPLGKFDFGFQFRIENLWNVSYQVIRYYPNPGRSFSVGLQVLFK
jgi:iron complex outermembrane receptor protein